jgi:hypothetical protein
MQRGEHASAQYPKPFGLGVLCAYLGLGVARSR